MAMLGRGVLILMLALAVAPAVAAPGPSGGAVLAVEAYIAAVQEGDEAATRCLWSAPYLAEASALGIRYPGVICPWDLASPVTADQRLGRRAVYRVEAPVLDGGTGVVTVVRTAGGTPAVHDYGVVWENGAWRLADRIWLAGRSWPERRTIYTRLRGEDVEGLDPAACTALDHEVERQAGLLGAGPEHLAEMAAAGIPYYVTDDATVAALTGYPTRGMANLAAGAVISSDFPHFHEMAHLVANAVLGEIPLHTHPLLQEGLACRLGGRWGRAPAAILYTGWFHLDLDLITVAEVLTWEGFHRSTAGPDGSYAVAALVVDLVRERAGWDGVRRLYRQCSGPPQTLQSWTAPEVARLVLDACGLSGDVAALETAVREHAARWRRCGLWPGVDVTRDLHWRRLEGARGTVAVARHEDRWLVGVAARDYPFLVTLDGPLPDGGGTGSVPGRLFAEQWPQREREGARWGLVCRPDNVGLYDYATNRLVSTWVAGFSGEDPLEDEPSLGLTFAVAVPDELVGIPLEDLHLSLP